MKIGKRGRDRRKTVGVDAGHDMEDRIGRLR